MADSEREGYARLPQAPAGKPKPTDHVLELEDKPRQNYSDGIHWKSPTLMACSLLTGMIFALIHHFFYHYWSGRKAGDDTQQQWITRGGTFFAFAFKVSLAAGGGVAYVQFLWMSLRKRPFRVRDVDSMFGILSNPLSFRLLKLWARLPLLTIVAALVWLMPLAAIITPGSLTVILTPEITSDAGRVPSLDFQNQMSNFGLTSSILSMVPPQFNSTYAITFPGPALKCTQGTLHDLKAIGTIIANDNQRNPSVIFDYMAWTPGQGMTNQTYPPLQMPGLVQTDFSEPIQSDEEESSPAPGYSVYIYAPMWGNSENGPFLLQCTLYNVSYSVNFTFESGSQNLHIQPGPKADLIPLGAPRIYAPATYGSNPDVARYNEAISYLSLMYAFGTLVTGSIGTSIEVGTQIIQSTMLMSTLLSQRLTSAVANPTPDNATVRAAFEELFQNITFSLFSSSQYLLNTSIPSQALSAPTPLVTVTQPVTKYTYNAFSLWLAYGLALLGESVCLMIGFYALHNNRVAFTNDFSSIMRATRRRELDSLVVGREFSGADPAAEHMLNALISYHLSSDPKAGFVVGKEE